MKKYPKVFAVVLNWNGGDTVKKCLAGVFKSDYENLEVVMVDNDSGDGSFEIARANFSKASFIKNTSNLGFSAAANIGIKYALERAADYVLILKENIEIDKDLILKLIEVAEKQRAGVAGPVIFKNKDKSILFAGSKVHWIKMETKYLQKTKLDESFETDFVSTSAMLVGAAVFKEISILDEDYFMYYEDVDFSRRAKKAGFSSVVVPGAWAYHMEEKNRDEEDKLYWQTVSGLIFFRKNSSYLIKPAQRLVFLARRIKNWLGTSLFKNKTEMVRKKAYADFKKVESW